MAQGFQGRPPFKKTKTYKSIQGYIHKLSLMKPGNKLPYCTAILQTSEEDEHGTTVLAFSSAKRDELKYFQETKSSVMLANVSADASSGQKKSTDKYIIHYLCSTLFISTQLSLWTYRPSLRRSKRSCSK